MEPLTVKIIASACMIGMIAVASCFMVWMSEMEQKALEKKIRKEVEQELGIEEATCSKEVFEPIDDRFDIMDL